MLSSDILDNILTGSEEDAWGQILAELEGIFSPDFESSAVQEIIKREKSISHLETLLSGACWDIWSSFERVVPKTSQLLVDFWNAQQTGKAILILDGLSLREMPFLLDEARKRGYIIHQSKIVGSELPSETTFFAKSLGFSQRSSLENNGFGTTHFFQGAKTDCVDLPWRDCMSLINAEPNWVLWHTWFDDRIHECSEPGKGLRELSMKSEEHFTSNDFWSLVDRLATGRQLIITSDHGYAATGEFINANEEQTNYLRTLYKSKRFTKAEDSNSKWISPIDLCLESKHGSFRYVLGRRKWKSSGGYPTLAHGGLSLMETLVPFIEFGSR